MIDEERKHDIVTNKDLVSRDVRVVRFGIEIEKFILAKANECHNVGDPQGVGICSRYDELIKEFRANFMEKKVT